MSRKAKGLSENQPLTEPVFPALRRILFFSRANLSSVPGRTQLTGPLDLMGVALPSEPPHSTSSTCRVIPPLSGPAHAIGTPLLCAPLSQSYTIPTDNTKYHCKHFPPGQATCFKSSSFVTIHFKKRVKQSTTVEQKCQKFHSFK